MREAVVRRWGSLRPIWLLLAIELVHLCTLFPGVGGRVNAGDSAKFQFIGKVVGLSHPPGNPLYVLLDAAWVRLPWPFRTATQVTLLSTLFGALTLLFVFRALERLAGARSAVLGALALGLGSLFWTFATEAEVYTLNSCLLAASCDYASRFALEGAPRPLLTCAFFLLLGFANHLTCIALVPAFAWLCWSARATPARIDWKRGLMIAGFAALSAALYAYVPLRAWSSPAYSELTKPVGWGSVFRYLTAQEFQGNFGFYSLEDAVLERIPEPMRELQKQWMWPVLALVPFGMLQIRTRSNTFFVFLLLALGGLALFAVTYEIPDPDGFYLPIVTLLALPIGASLRELPANRLWSVGLVAGIAMCLGATAVVHVRSWSKQTGREVVFKMGKGNPFILWDLDDLFTRIPEGARFALPCGHYGCVEVLNYYRFADPVPARRKLSFVLLPGIESDYFRLSRAVEKLGFEAARGLVVCSIRSQDAEEMRRTGASVRTLERGSRTIAGRLYEGVPIYCSTPLPRSRPGRRSRLRGRADPRSGARHVSGAASEVPERGQRKQVRKPQALGPAKNSAGRTGMAARG